MSFNLEHLRRSFFWATAVLAAASPVGAQRKLQSPPAVDYPRDNITS